MTTEKRKRARQLALTIIQALGFILTFGYFFRDPPSSSPGRSRPPPD